MAWGTTTSQPLREGGPRAPQPTWLARPLLLSHGMRSWHDRAAQNFVAMPPPPCACTLPTPSDRDPPSSDLSPEEPGRRVSHLERDPPGRRSF
jgi:hypothetical protein